MSVNIKIDFEGLDEIQKKVEEVGGERLLNAVNREIIQKGQRLAGEIIANQMPKSSDITTSGPKRYGKSRKVPSGHMFSEIPFSTITKKGPAIGGWVGWAPSNDDENFYAKFFEEGVEQHRAYSNGKRPVPAIKGNKIFAKTGSQIQPMINQLGVAAYQKILQEALD